MVDALHPIAQIVELQNDRMQQSVSERGTAGSQQTQSVSARGTPGSQHEAKECPDSHVHLRQQVIQSVAVSMQLRDIATHTCYVNILFFEI